MSSERSSWSYKKGLHEHLWGRYEHCTGLTLMNLGPINVDIMVAPTEDRIAKPWWFIDEMITVSRRLMHIQENSSGPG